MGSTAPDITGSVFKTFMVAARYRIILQVEWVGSSTILHSGADLLSRIVMDEDMRLLPQAYDLARRWAGFSPVIDLFGDADVHGVQRDKTGHRLPFYSRVPQPLATGALGCDALAHRWEGLLYAFPPTPLVLATVEKASRSACRVLLITPVRPSQPWWPLLVNKPFLDLGVASQCCSPGPTGQWWLHGQSDPRMRAWLLTTESPPPGH
jgi:hypothetical protein